MHDCDICLEKRTLQQRANILSRVPTEEIMEDYVELYIGETDKLEKSLFLIGIERKGQQNVVPDLEII